MTGMYVNTPPRLPPLSILSVEIDFSFAEREIVEVNNHAGEISRGVHCRLRLHLLGARFRVGTLFLSSPPIRGKTSRR